MSFIKYRIIIIILIVCNNTFYVNSLDLNDDQDKLLNLLINNIQADYRDTPINRGNIDRLQIEINRKVDGFARSISSSIEAINRKWKRHTESEGMLEINTQNNEQISLNGFTENGTVPVDFPLDICLFELNDQLYAATLNGHLATENVTVNFTLYKRKESEFLEIVSYEIESAKSLDCLSVTDRYAYIAIVKYFNESALNIYQGSPIYRIGSDDHIEVVQYIIEPFQYKLRFWHTDNDFYLFQSFNRTNFGNKIDQCPVYKLSGNNFNYFDELQCENRAIIEQFRIDGRIFIGIGGTSNGHGDGLFENNYSFIYKLNVVEQKFKIYQRIGQFSVIDIKHFRMVNENGTIDDYLLIGSSIGNETLDVNVKPSVIYKYIDGYFTPYQSLMYYGVEQFLPVQNDEFTNLRRFALYNLYGVFSSVACGQYLHENINEPFLLLISCQNEPITIIEYKMGRFVESPIQLTGGALGRGVSKLRLYNLSNQSAIVIANNEMLSDATNIYYPKFKRKSIILTKQSDGKVDEKWCEETLKQFNWSDLILMNEMLAKVPLSTDESIHLDGRSYTFDKLNVKEIFTESLETPHGILNKELIDSINKIYDLVIVLDSKLTRLENRIRSDDLLTSMTRIGERIDLPSMFIDSNKFDFDNLNLTELEITDELIIEQLNGHPIQDLVYKNSNLNLTELIVDNLTVNSVENYQEIIRKSSISNRSKRTHDSLTNITELTVDNLKLNGKINGIDINTLITFTLKRNNGKQIITGPINFETVTVQNVKLKQGKLSTVPLANLVRIDSNETEIIDRELQFIEPIKIDRLILVDRINNIQVDDRGGLDILLKQSATQQIVKGHKIFEHLKLLQPISLQGKIKSDTLEKMNPIVTINRDLELSGDFRLTGNVTFQKILQANNVVTKTGRFSFKKLFDDGLRIGDPINNLNLQFTQPIQVRNLMAKNINGIDCQQFVRTNIDGPEIIYGKKIFKGDLHVEDGACDALEINGIDLKRLNETVLKTVGDQVIQGTIHFKKIEANRINSNHITLAGTSITNYWNRNDTNQKFIGNITIIGDVTVDSHLEIDHLINPNQIFGFNLLEMIEDTILNDRSDIILTGNKIFRQPLTIDNIELGTNFWPGGKTTEEIMNQIDANQMVELIEPITLAGDIVIDDLIVNGWINGIPIDEFGHVWLMKAGDQTFTEPQTIVKATMNNGIHIQNGMLNGIDLQSTFSKTIWIDQPIELSTVTFDHLTAGNVTITGQINGLKFPDDFIFKQSVNEQFIGNIQLSGDLTVAEGFALHINRINQLEFGKLVDIVSSKPSPFGLKIIGTPTFIREPIFETINGYNWQQLSNEVWLSNRPTTFYGQLTFDDVVFENGLNIKGLINGYDIRILSYKYFNRNQSEDINKEYHFRYCYFQNDIDVGHLYVNGKIRDLDYNKNYMEIDIVDFNQNVLKHNTDQIITARWDVYGVVIKGDIDQTLINGLNLNDDIVRYSSPNNIITAQKQISNLSITNLNCKRNCQIQDVNIGDWISKSCLIQGNYTIQGDTTINSPEILFESDIRVQGFVNGFKFNADDILLISTNQTITGDLHINNTFPERNQIEPLSIQNLNVDKINGKSVNDFLSNIVRYNDLTGNEIVGKLRFSDRLTVHNLETIHLAGVNVSELLDRFKYEQIKDSENVRMYREKADRLMEIGDELNGRLTNKTLQTELSHFENIHKFNGFIKSMTAFSVENGTNRRDILVVIQRNLLKFYNFDSMDRRLMADGDFSSIRPIDSDEEILKICSFPILFDEMMDYLYMETFNRSVEEKFPFKQYFLKPFNGSFRIIHEMNSSTSKNFVKLIPNCFILFASQFNPTQGWIDFICLSVKGDLLYFLKKGQIKFTDSIKDVLFIPDDFHSKLIILTMNGTVQIWSLDTVKWTGSLIQEINHLNTIDITSGTFNNHKYLSIAVGPTTEPLKPGSIEIYRLNSRATGDFKSFESFDSNQPIQIEFSHHRSGDFVLYVLASDPMLPIKLYKYRGINGFGREPKQLVSLINGQHFGLLKLNNVRLELIAVVSRNETNLIEVVHLVN